MVYCIETDKLTKTFPVIKGYGDLVLHPFRKQRITALSHVDIQIQRGEIFGLLGQNGAGKTTLIKILCTLILPTSGRAFVNGMEVTREDKKIKRSIGYVLGDERSFYWRLTGRQNLRFFAKLNNIFGQEGADRIQKLLHELDLERDADRLFKDYSTGMRKRLAIARGLLTDPLIIIMDEPTSGLDPVTAQNFRKLIRNKLVDKGRTVVFATHNLQEAEDLCDRVAIVHKGEIKATGTVYELKKAFHKNKNYVIRLKHPGDGLLEKISDMVKIRQVIPLSTGTDSQVTQLEIESGGEESRISGVIKEILEAGGMLHSLNEKEPSLEDLFSRIVHSEDKK